MSSNSNPSLCIPRVFPNIDEKRIRRIFSELNLGEIQRVDIVNKTTEKGEKFNRVFIHFQRWFSNSNADTAKERLLNGKEIKIVYDDPWFWKVSAYRPPQTNHHNHPQQQSKAAAAARPRIQFDDSDESPPQQQHQKQHQKPPLAPRLPPKRQIAPKKQQAPAKKTHADIEEGEIVEK